MHGFSDLIGRCVTFNLVHHYETQQVISEKLHASSATPFVKAIQTLRLHKAIVVVGMFSMFEAILQKRLGARDGFAEAKAILVNGQHARLLQKFEDLNLAVNVLKHGTGRSYNDLVARHEQIDFKIKLPGQNFFYEGDVSEVDILVDVDEAFISSCGQIIEDVSAALKIARPGIHI